MSTKTVNIKSTREYWNKRVKESKGDEMQLVFNSVTAFSRSYELGQMMIKNFVKPGMSVLDLGCGYGRFYDDIIHAGASYTGMDFSEEMIFEAKKRFPNGNFVCNSAFATLSQKFDVVFECVCLSSFNFNIDELADLVRSHLRTDAVNFGILIEDDEVRIVTTTGLIVHK